MNAEQEDMDITLPMLETIGRQSDITQRYLAKQLNLALGLTNSYLKNSIRKGLIKIEQVPANRYLYYLTPKGLTEKSRLAAKYLKRSFHFYRQASDDCFRLFQRCGEQGWNNVVICGVSDLAEIAILQAAKAQVEIVGVYDQRHRLEHFFGKASWQDLACLPENPVCLITALERPLRMRQALLKVTAEDRVLVPGILKI